jgi:hypothetical protein
MPELSFGMQVVYIPKLRKTACVHKVFATVIFYQSIGEGSPYYCGTGSNWQIGCYFDHPITQTNLSGLVYLSYVLVL